jgi:hypothetical protein
MHLHFVERGKRNFELRAVHEHARNAEAERAVEAIARAAREHGCTRADAAAVRARDHAVARAIEPRHPDAGAQDRTGADRGGGEIAIELRPIDDGGADALDVDRDAGAVR